MPNISIHFQLISTHCWRTFPPCLWFLCCLEFENAVKRGFKHFTKKLEAKAKGITLKEDDEENDDDAKKKRRQRRKANATLDKPSLRYLKLWLPLHLMWSSSVSIPLTHFMHKFWCTHSFRSPHFTFLILQWSNSKRRYRYNSREQFFFEFRFP